MDEKTEFDLINILTLLKNNANEHEISSIDNSQYLEEFEGSIKDTNSINSDYEEEVKQNENNDISDGMKSVLLNLTDLSNLKVDNPNEESDKKKKEKEDDEKDENKEFFRYLYKKSIKKIRLSLSDKKKLVDLNRQDPKKYSLANLNRLTGVRARTIGTYKTAYGEICEQTDLNKCRVFKPTKNSIHVQEIDQEILKFVDRLRDEKKAVTTNMIIAKMIQLEPELKEKSKKTLQERVYRFLERNNYSIRRSSHIGQPLPSKSMDLFFEFFRDVINKRQKLGIYDRTGDYDRIVNIDETPIYFEMTSDKTISKKGLKTINVETNGNEKKLISCVLAVSAGGKKLRPTLIFKGGRDGNLESRYNNLECVKKKKISIYFQSNAWCDEAIFKKWLKDVYIEYEEEFMKKKCILIMDRSPSHIYRSKFLDKKGKNYVFIPGGLTRYLQPLDIGINKVFKEQLKNNYLSDLAENIEDNFDEREDEKMKNFKNAFGDNKSPSELDKQRLNIINWVIDVWWNDEKIKISSIINSFKKAGIT